MQSRESLVDLLLRQVELGPERCAIIHGDQRLSYGDLWKSVINLSWELRERGIEAGARVLLFMDSSADYVIAYYALGYIGAVSVPLNTGLKASQLPDIASHAQSSLLLYSGTPRNLQECLPHLEELGVQCWNLAAPESRRRISVASAECLPTKRAPCDLSSIVYTSGTTGRPKGVMLSRHNLYSNTLAIVEYLNLSAADRGLCVLPFYYVYGSSVLHTHLAAGASLVLENSLMYPQQIMSVMAQEEVTGFAGVPSTFRLLLNRCDLQAHPLPHLRYVTQAGGPLSPENRQRIVRAWPQVRFYVMYGQTEATARLSYLPPERLQEKPASVGIPVPGVSLKIVDEQGRDQPVGVEGEICASGPNIMMGYWRDPDATRKKMLGEWLRTGDLGFLDEEGFLTIVGRNSDQIKTGDHRVAPEEIEDVIADFEGVEEVAVVGIPDALLGQAIKACIVPRSGIILERRDLLRHCSLRLASYKLPKIIQIVDALPKTASGKVQRYLLQMPDQQEHCAQRELT